jgi:hypothetical protein
VITAAQRAVYRKMLLDAGFAPVPLNGKRPVLDDWPSLLATGADIERWGRERGSAQNTGYLTRWTPTLDIDIVSPEGAEAVESLVKDRYGDAGALLVRIGRAPKRAIPFTTDRPFAKIVVSLTAPNGHEERLEFLADGQQCVADGDHPDTHQPYRWIGGAPGKVKRDELPTIDERAAQELVNDAAELLIAEHGYRRAAPPPAPRPNGALVSDAGAWGFISNAIDHDALVRGAMSLLQAGMHDAAAVNFLRAAVSGLADVDEDRRQRRLDEIPAMVRSARTKLGDEPLEIGERAPASEVGDDLEVVTLPPREIKAIPPRQWAYGRFLQFGSAAVLGAPDGLGKGFVTTAMALSMVFGVALLGERVWKTGPVCIITYEDDREEWERRIAAACLWYRLDFAQAMRNIHFIRHATELPVVFAQRDDSGRVVFPDSVAIVREVRAYQAVLLVVDPFNAAHALDDGNSNVLIARVAQEVTRIAHATHAAALVLHHLRKGSTGEVDDLMGATSLRATFRNARILVRMTGQQAQDLGIRPDQAFRYFRIAGSKENYAPPPEKTHWFKLESQQLGNDTDDYPDGDDLAVATVWAPPSPFQGVSLPTLDRVFARLRAGIEGGRGWCYSAETRAKYWAGAVLMDEGKISKTQAKSALDTWVASGVIRSEDYWTPSNSQSTRIVLDEVKIAAILAPLQMPALDPD